MKKSIILISSALLLIAGCAKEQLAELAVPNEYDGPVTIVGATYEQYAPEGGTKASFDANGIFGWESSDAALFELEGSNSWANASAQDITENKLYCTFTIVGTLSKDMVAVLPSDLSPVRYNVESANDGLKVTIPASRTWKKDQSYATMIGFGTANGQSYKFSHLCGLAKVTVNGVPADARKFVFKTKGFKISGEFEAGKINSSGNQTISTAAASPAATSVDDFTEDEETYSLTFTSDDISSNNGVMEFNVPLPCGTYSNGFAFCFKDENNSVIYKFEGSASKEILRTKRIILPTINISGGGGEESKTIQNVPADHNGDFYLADAKNVLVNIPSGENAEKTINFKYYGTKPEKLEIHVVGNSTPGTYKGTISGNLSETHVDFTQGDIANVEMTTSASTFEIVYPAKISEKLTVKGGNVKVKGATVAEIEVDENAKADGDKAPVEIVVEKVGVNVPAVTNGIKANADVVVAPAENVTVKVTTEGDAKVANGGAGTVKDKDNNDITTKAAAKIDDIKYITLADAIAAVKDNEEIELVVDVTDAKGITVPSGKNFTVNFGGKTYTCASDPAGSTNTKNQVFQLLKGSTITFKNGTINVAGIAKEKFRFIIQNYADLTLEDITLDGTNLAISDGRVNYTVSNNFGSIEFKGATTIKAAATKGVAFDVCKSNDSVNYPEPPTVTVNTTGTIEGQVEVTGGKLVVEAGTFKTTGARRTSTANHQSPTLLVSSGEVTVKGGSFTSEHDVAVRAEGGSVTLEGGTFTAPEGAVCFPGVGAIINIKGGTYTASDNAVIIGQGSEKDGNANTVNISGGTFTGNISSLGYIACGIYAPWKDNITVTGGTFNITNGAGVVARAGVVTIDGGTFNCTGTTKGGVGDKSVQLPCECLIFDDSNPDYPGKDASSKIIVKKGTFSDLSGVKYVDDNAIYTLGANVTNAAGMSFDTKKTFIVDFNNHTYTVNKPGAGSTNTQTLAFQLLKDQTITFKNGTINAATENLNATESDGKKPIKRFIQNYANLTLTDMTLDGTNINGNNSVVEFCNGTVTINGSTNFTAKSGVATINVDSWTDYPKGTAVTINTTGNVGKIHCYAEGAGSMTTNSSLTIKNGKNISIDDASNGKVTISVEGGELVGPPVGALKGEFSVSPTKKVHFSQGNLTYNVSTTTWAFYEHQYDCATGYDADLISLFTWGYNKDTSTDPDGESYVTGHTSVPEHLEDTEAWESFSASEDWGSQIGDGKTWRTLTAAEWQYLFNTREASTVSGTHNARYAKATVGSISGIILLPDKYEHPSGVAALTNINTSDAGYTANSYDVTTWAAMEDAGAVFLSAADYREGDEVDYGNTFGSYWSSTACRAEYAYCVEFDSTNSNVDPENNYLDPEYVDERAYGCSVRLVTESN